MSRITRRETVGNRVITHEIFSPDPYERDGKVYVKNILGEESEVHPFVTKYAQDQKLLASLAAKEQ